MGEFRKAGDDKTRPPEGWSDFPSPLPELGPGRLGPRSVPTDAELVRVAARQSNVLDLRQLAVLGLSRAAVSARARRGRLWRIHSGVYAVGRPDLDRRGKWIAALLASGADCALSEASAAAAVGLLAEHSPAVHIATIGRRGRGRPGIRLHRPRALTLADLGWAGGIPCTSVARTCLDLSAHLSDPRLEDVLDRAERVRLFDLAEFNSVLRRAGGHRGAPRLRRCLGAGPTGEVRSGLERLFRELCAAHGIPPPATNVVVAGYEVDAFWPDAGLVVEVDSYGYHHTRRDRAKDAERDAVLRLAGLELLRVSDEMLEQRPAEAASRVRAMRERGLATRSSHRRRGRALSSQG